VSDWWESFFDAQYLDLWGPSFTAEQTAAEADGLWRLLGLAPGSRVIDAPCGQGRLTRVLAERGAEVVGIDQSIDLLATAEAARGGLPTSRLRYRRQDLRQPLTETGFDAAFNVFSSLGYGSEADDLAVFRNLRAAVRDGGLVFFDTAHRDLMAAKLARGLTNTDVLPDGTLCVERVKLDPVAGRVESTWHWAGPAGTGKKVGSLRVYTITELVRLLAQAGLELVSLHRGCSTDPFVAEGPMVGGRVGLLTRR
jgi:cyclopropane fatty-acyl-phospholipid synthase-like methyltransferase